VAKSLGAFAADEATETASSGLADLGCSWWGYGGGQFAQCRPPDHPESILQDVYSFSTALSALAVAGQWQLALGFLERMMEAQVFKDCGRGSHSIPSFWMFWVIPF